MLQVVRERRAANRIMYLLMADQLAVCLADFLSAVCPDQVLLRYRRRRKAGAGPEAEGA